MEYIEFVCGHNSGRSQMAQHLLNEKLKEAGLAQQWEAISWGTAKGDKLNTLVVEAMAKRGSELDPEIYFPKDDSDESLKDKLPHVKRVITMGCMVAPYKPPKEVKVEKVEDWGLDDPADPETDIKSVIDGIMSKVEELVLQLK